jgi:hypothetical protein
LDAVNVGINLDHVSGQLVLPGHAQHVPHHAIGGVPLRRRGWSPHVLVADEVREHEPGLKAVLPEEVKVRESVSQLED